MISVVVPVYNVERYLPRCMASLLAQTWRNFEVVLVDDGSRDSSGQLCDEYAAKDERVRVLHQPNQGVSAARQNGLYEARGEYIAFLDGDDWVQPDYLERLIEAAQRDQADIICCDFHNYGTDGQQTSDTHKPVPEQTVYGREAIRELFFSWNYLIHLVVWGKLIRSDLAKKGLFLPIRYGEDLAYMIGVMENAASVTYIGYQGYCYLIHEQSVSGQGKRLHHVSERNAVDSVRAWSEVLAYARRGGKAEEIASAYVNYAWRWYDIISCDVRFNDRASFNQKHSSLAPKIQEMMNEGKMALTCRVVLWTYVHCPSCAWLLIRLIVRLRS